jgi:hypothetical protein
VSALNLAFARSSGEIMGWLAAGDLLLPGALAALAHFFRQHPDVDVVYGQRVIVNARGQEVSRWVVPPHAERFLPWSDCLPRETVFWRRSIWERAGARLDEGLQQAASWDLLVRFQQQGAHFARLPRFLGASRTHLPRSAPELSAEADLVRQRYLGRVPSSAEVARALRPLVWRTLAWNRLYSRGVLRY